MSNRFPVKTFYKIMLPVFMFILIQSQAQGFSFNFQPESKNSILHRYHALITAASMKGQKDVTLSHALQLKKLTQSLVSKNPSMQPGLTFYWLSLARFGDWQTLLETEPPPKQYQYALAIWYYTHGLAASKLGQQQLAQADLTRLNTFLQDGSSKRNLGKNGYQHLEMASFILHGVIAQNTGDTDTLVADLLMAVSIQDRLLHSDSSEWYFPVRQLLGTALLVDDRYQQAEIIFLQDLKQNPGNGWSLYGMWQVKKALKEPKDAEAYHEQFKAAWREADIKKPVYPIRQVREANETN